MTCAPQKSCNVLQIELRLLTLIAISTLDVDCGPGIVLCRYFSQWLQLFATCTMKSSDVTLCRKPTESGPLAFQYARFQFSSVQAHTINSRSAMFHVLAMLNSLFDSNRLSGRTLPLPKYKGSLSLPSRARFWPGCTACACAAGAGWKLGKAE